VPDGEEEEPIDGVRPEGFSFPHAIMIAVMMNARAKARARGIDLLTIECMLGFVRVCSAHSGRGL
jgi:hypothetical protein